MSEYTVWVPGIDAGGNPGKINAMDLSDPECRRLILNALADNGILKGEPVFESDEEEHASRPFRIEGYFGFKGEYEGMTR